MTTVLIADDEPNVRKTLSTTFEIEGFRAITVENGEQALHAVARGGIDLLLLDLQMPLLDGLETLRHLRREGHELPVIFLTAHGTIESAVQAVRLGAFDFIEKPAHAEKILIAARNALRQSLLEQENRELRDEEQAQFEMIGQSAPMRELFEGIRRVAPTQARVLVLGENGTGKELVARALHRHSPRADRPFVRVNCAAIPRELFESELFGHEKGAFTGATSRRRGKFLRAHRGTLFLDEVGEIPDELQVKLLRALESGEIEPVGSDREMRADVRVVAATNRDLETAVAQGGFRKDLYYRLQVVTLEVPPLRARKEDLPALVEHFLRSACIENHLPSKRIVPRALERLSEHDFPGNVRELRNWIERLVILTPGREIDAARIEETFPAIRAAGEPISGAQPTRLRTALAAFERDWIRRALERHRWKISAAAEELEIERSHLYKKLKTLGIERPD